MIRVIVRMRCIDIQKKRVRASERIAYFKSTLHDLWSIVARDQRESIQKQTKKTNQTDIFSCSFNFLFLNVFLTLFYWCFSSVFVLLLLWLSFAYQNLFNLLIFLACFCSLDDFAGWESIVREIIQKPKWTK